MGWRKKRSQLKEYYGFLRYPWHFQGPRELYCGSMISGHSIQWLAFCKKPNQKIFKTREMRTHLRCDGAPKSGPSANQFSIGFSVVKWWKYNQFFHPRCKSTLKFDRFVLGPLFWAPSRRRCVRISWVLNIFWFGFLQSARNWVIRNYFQSIGTVSATWKNGRGQPIHVWP